MRRRAPVAALALVATLVGAPAAGAKQSTSDAATIKHLQALAHEAAPRVGKALGESLKLAVKVHLTKKSTQDDADAYAYVFPRPRKTGEKDAARFGDKGTCVINVTHNGEAASTERQRYILSHELVHCFYQQLDHFKEDADAGNWTVEGGAQFVAERVVANWDVADGFKLRRDWKKYFAPVAITSKAYDSWPIFDLLDAAGGDPMHFLRATYAADDPPAKAFTRMADAAPQGFLDRVAPAATRLPGLGSAWTMPDNEYEVPVSQAALPTPKQPLTQGGSFTLSVPAYAMRAAEIAPSADVVRVTVDTPGTARGMFHTEKSDALTSASYCTTADCTCPGQAALPRLGALPYVAVLAAGGGAKVTFTGVSKDAACQAEGSPGAGGGPGTGAGPATGSNLDATGPVGAHGSVPGSCGLYSDGFLLCDFEMRDPTGKLYVGQLSTMKYAGTGTYAATGRGVTSGPDVRFTDSLGNGWDTAALEHDEAAGGYTIDTVTAGAMTGTVSATMRNQDDGSTETLTGTWTAALTTYS